MAKKKRDILKDEMDHLRVCLNCLEDPASAADSEGLDAMMFQLQYSLVAFWKRWRTL